MRSLSWAVKMRRCGRAVSSGDQKGFVVLERCWVVECSLGWLVHWGGLLRDYAGRLDVSAARIACAAMLSGIEALINPMPVHSKTA